MGFEDLRPELERYVASLRGYRKNNFELDEGRQIACSSALGICIQSVWVSALKLELKEAASSPSRSDRSPERLLGLH